MQVDSLERLINAADPSDFKSLALEYLTSLGYTEVAVTDGRGDLGRDIQVWTRAGSAEPIAVQISVQRKGWKEKVKRDALEVKSRLKLSNFTYLTTHRISPGDEQILVADLLSEGISARFVDCRAIASLFHVKRRTQDAIEALGISLRESAYGQYLEKPTLKEDLAYSYAFFGADVETFRKDVIERGVTAFITREQKPPKRSDVEAAVGSNLGLDQERFSMISSRIDHMLQRGDLLSADGHLAVSDDLSREAKAVRVLRSKQWRELQDAISTNLGSAGLKGQKLDRTTEITCETAGALLMGSAEAVHMTVRPGGDPAPVRKQIEVDLRRLEHQLTNAGLALGEAQDLIKELAVQVSESEIGQTLLAGYLFVSLLDMSGSRLLQALGGQARLEVYLDASVAIPILASLLFQSHEDNFFVRSLHAYELAMQHEVVLILPRDYLEEAASHLIDAAQLYEPIRAAGEDLRFSKNAFVAHFATLSQDPHFKRTFAQYAQSFGLTQAHVPRPQFRAIRNRVMDQMSQQFKQYAIRVVALESPTSEAMAEAQSDIAFTARELKIQRATRLLDHDARTVAALSSGVGELPAVVLCTWDRLHLKLAATDRGGSSWQAMNASMLSDLLALASPQPSSPVGAYVDIALSLNRNESQLASQIWDELVAIESKNLYDADLLGQARAFKDDYLARAREEKDTEPLAAAWMEWKASSQSGR